MFQKQIYLINDFVPDSMQMYQKQTSQNQTSQNQTTKKDHLQSFLSQNGWGLFRDIPILPQIRR